MTLGARLAIVGWALATLGCGAEAAPAEPLTIRSEEMQAADIPEGPVTGTIAGEEFTALDARFRVERYPGRERLDLIFYPERRADCGLPVARDTGSVFLRFDGVTELTTGEQRIDPGDEDPAFGVHYELKEERMFSGVAGGAALLSLDEVRPTAIIGRVRVCFDDGRGSCVMGRFEAIECRSPVDGFSTREGGGQNDLPADELPEEIRNRPSAPHPPAGESPAGTEEPGEAAEPAEAPMEPGTDG